MLNTPQPQTPGQKPLVAPIMTGQKSTEQQKNSVLQNNPKPDNKNHENDTLANAADMKPKNISKEVNSAATNEGMQNVPSDKDPQREQEENDRPRADVKPKSSY